MNAPTFSELPRLNFPQYAQDQAKALHTAYLLLIDETIEARKTAAAVVAEVNEATAKAAPVAELTKLLGKARRGVYQAFEREVKTREKLAELMRLLSTDHSAFVNRETAALMAEMKRLNEEIRKLGWAKDAELPHSFLTAHPTVNYHFRTSGADFGGYRQTADLNQKALAETRTALISAAAEL